MLAATVAVSLAGCVTSPDGSTDDSSPSETVDEPSAPADAQFAFTGVDARGSRVLDGVGDITTGTETWIPTRETPRWLVGHPAASGSAMASVWTVVAENGRARTHRVDDRVTLVAEHGRVHTPPVGWRTSDRTVRTEAVARTDTEGGDRTDTEGGGEPVGVVTPPAELAPHTHPIPTRRGWLFVAGDGRLVHRQDGGRASFDVGAPPDARPVPVGGDRYAVYGGATSRYRHGALGDSVEASRLLVVDTAAERVVVDHSLERSVFEGFAPLPVELGGVSGLLTTVADARDGARLRLYGTDGEPRATGPVYGSGWRHRLCVADFGAGREVAVVRKPHVDRTIEFYRFGDGELRVTARRAGYSTHTYGSRVLDGALAGDLDADGTVELLLPQTSRRRLDAVRRSGDDGTRVVWSLPLGGRLTTNVAGVSTGEGVAVAAGTADGVRVWHGPA